MKEYKFIDNYLEELKFQESIDLEKNWDQLSARIHRLNFRTKLMQFCKSAAAILFLPLILVSGYLYYRTTAEKPVELIEQTCASGLVTTITLPDGTRIWLNSGSKLTYPNRFSSKTRTVKLEGEGYFNVRTDRKHPFEVELINGAKVNAYGTEFDISAYYGNNQVEVVLVKGNVEVVDKNSQSFSLKPDYRLILGEGKPVLDKTNVYVKTAWKDGKIVFRRAGMEEITRKLALHFNVDIELVGGGMDDYQLSATFTTESLKQILLLIEKSTPIRWTVIEPVMKEDMSYTKRKIIIQSLQNSKTVLTK